MNERRVKESITADVRGTERDGIRGMKEWQSGKVEEVGEEERREQCERVQRWEAGENRGWIDGCIL